MSDEILVTRPESPNDWESYFELRWRVLRAPWQQPRGSERDPLDSESVNLMVCGVDRGPRAVGRLHFPSPDVGQVRYMAVDPAWRRRGMGRRVLKELERVAKQKGAKKIRLNARENAVPFYESQGYAVVGRGELLFGEIRHEVMEKKLG